MLIFTKAALEKEKRLLLCPGLVYIQYPPSARLWLPSASSAQSCSIRCQSQFSPAICFGDIMGVVPLSIRDLGSVTTKFHDQGRAETPVRYPWATIATGVKVLTPNALVTRIPRILQARNVPKIRRRSRGQSPLLALTLVSVMSAALIMILHASRMAP